MRSETTLAPAAASVLLSARSTFKSKLRMTHRHGQNAPSGSIALVGAPAVEIESEIFEPGKTCRLCIGVRNPRAVRMHASHSE